MLFAMVDVSWNSNGDPMQLPTMAPRRAPRKTGNLWTEQQLLIKFDNKTQFNRQEFPNSAFRFNM